MTNLDAGEPVQEFVDSDPPIASVGGVVYRWTAVGQLEILLIKKQGGFWTLPKGQIKPGEDERDAVAREVAEETGISGMVEAAVLQVLYTIQKAGRRRRKAVTYYLMRADGGRLRPSRKERMARVRWFPVGAALRRIRRGRIRTVVRAARAILDDDAAAAGNNGAT